MPNLKIVVLSLPRSGSSLLTQLIVSAGYRFTVLSEHQRSFGAHEFNKYGYFEDVPFTLLNDQLIRLYFGLPYSFLYPPSFDLFLEIARNPSAYCPNKFMYDVDEKNVFIPRNFLRNIASFTGTHWDVWGITRMIQGGKWEHCYSNNNIETKEKILKTKDIYKHFIENSDVPLVLKDPRLAFVMPLYNFQNIKIIWIQRERADVLKSMRRHYGPGIFSKKFIHGTDYVSNHFNHKIRFMDFETYCDRYEQTIQYTLSQYPHFVITFDDLIHLRNIRKLEHFIGGHVTDSIVDQNLLAR